MKFIEAGVVKELKDGQAIVVLSGTQSSLCERCGVCAQTPAGLREVRAAAPPGTKPGEAVQVEVNLPPRYASIFALLVVPLLGFLVGAVIGQAITPLGQVAPMLFGLVFMALSFAGGFLYDRQLARRGAGRAVIVVARRGDEAEPPRAGA